MSRLNLVTDGDPFGRGEQPSFQLSDLGNAERIAWKYAGRMRYCAVTGKWLVWDGPRWSRDGTEQVMRFAKDCARAMMLEATEEPDQKNREKLGRWALKSQNEPEIRRAILLARSEDGIAVRTDALDTDPNLLNCQNGTVDLRTGKLREHRPGDLITKLAPVVYNPAAKSPVFREFLDRIFRGHPDVAGYMQRAIGYALFGTNNEQCLFVMHGTGANGKSTLLEAVLAAIGDHGGKAEPGLLIASRDGSHPTGVADLFGLRLVVCSESNEARRFDEQRVKDLTGERTIKARYMRQDWFEFTATHTLFLATNHRPEIRDTGHAIWRRVKLIPFTETIGDDEKDPDLPEKLKAELPGILAWAIRGAVEWRRNGLQDPDEVRAAVAAYKAAEDVIGQWLVDRCMTELDGLSEQAQRLYDDYRRTCEGSGEDPTTQRRFGEELGARGFKRKRTKQGNRWFGIGLRVNSDDGGGADGHKARDNSPNGCMFQNTKPRLQALTRGGVWCVCAKGSPLYTRTH